MIINSQSYKNAKYSKKVRKQDLNQRRLKKSDSSKPRRGSATISRQKHKDIISERKNSKQNNNNNPSIHHHRVRTYEDYYDDEDEEPDLWRDEETKDNKYGGSIARYSEDNVYDSEHTAPIMIDIGQRVTLLVDSVEYPPDALILGKDFSIPVHGVFLASKSRVMKEILTTKPETPNPIKTSKKKFGKKKNKASHLSSVTNTSTATGTSSLQYCIPTKGSDSSKAKIVNNVIKLDDLFS
eukprot:UN23700